MGRFFSPFCEATKQPMVDFLSEITRSLSRSQATKFSSQAQNYEEKLGNWNSFDLFLILVIEKLFLQSEMGSRSNYCSRSFRGAIRGEILAVFRCSLSRPGDCPGWEGGGHPTMGGRECFNTLVCGSGSYNTPVCGRGSHNTLVGGRGSYNPWLVNWDPTIL